MLGLSHPIPSSVSMLHTFSRDFNMTANQLFFDINSQFQNQNFVHGDTAIDPGLGSLSAGITDNMASTLAGHQMMSAAFWHAGMDHQMRLNNQLPRTSQVDNGFDGFGESVSQDEPSEDVTTLSNTSKTRSTSENSNRPSRMRSMHSSRSSIPSTKSGSSEHVQKSRKGKQQSKRQRKQSNTSATSRTSSQQQYMQGSWDETNEHGEKRNCFLERNRIAASKCRQKKKEWVSDLEENKNKLENLNKNLHMEHNSLIAELTGMKNVLMTHANCHDPYIDQWIDNEARRFVQNTAERYASVPVLTLLIYAGSHHDSRRESFAIQPSPPMSIKSQPTSPKGDEINYGHMPDDMFEDQAIDIQA